jgi:hypothetical protein
MTVLNRRCWRNGKSAASHHGKVKRSDAISVHALFYELDAAALYDLARTELLRLGLLQAHFTTTKKGEIPEFDTGTDMMKASRKRLTPHGRLLLTQIGLATLEEA